jgi:hypothetical protein
MEKNKNLSQNDKVLMAALELSKGDTQNKFTAEELLIQAWKEDKSAFGLRGYENDHPDSNNLYTKLMGKSGLVRLGYLKKIGEKTYTLTEAGLSIASSFKPIDEERKLKIDRQLHDAVIKIINHQIFREWLVDQNKPNKFRDAMWFWGIAPGTPPKVVKERMSVIEQNLQEAKKKAIEGGGKIPLDSKEVNKSTKESLTRKGDTKIDEQKSRLLLDILDIDRCIEFYNYLKEKFKKELNLMLE